MSACSDSKLRDYHALLTKSVSSLECNKQSLLIVLRQEISLQSLLDPSIAAVSFFLESFIFEIVRSPDKQGHRQIHLVIYLI